LGNIDFPVEGFKRRIEYFPSSIIPHIRKKGFIVVCKIEVGFFVLYNNLSFFLCKKPVCHGVIIHPENETITAFAIDCQLVTIVRNL